MNRYEVIRGDFLLEGELHTGYGIRYGEISIPNIFCSEEAVENLVLECNALALDPIHIWEVVDDFLVGQLLLNA